MTAVIQLYGRKSSTTVCLVSLEDYEYLNQFRWCIVGKGHVGRTVRDFDKSGVLLRKYTVWMHHVVASRMGLNTPHQVDHKNLSKADNRRDNLRAATNSQNQANRPVSKNNSSGYKGVSFHAGTGRWQARIGVNRKRLFLGRFDTPEAAHEAYVQAAQRYFGEFSRGG